jgi:hypothetical protein
MKIKKLAMTIASLVLASSSMAAAIHDAGLFTGNTLARNDDGSTGLVALGFTANFFGGVNSNLFVNNNGNVTFTSALSTFTPTGLTTSSLKIIAPFWADVDTRNTAAGVVQYGANTLGGKNVFGVNWINVGYFNQQVNKLNSFQLILTDRSDIAAGDFDIEFNYDQIQWNTGGASGGSNGLGGSPASAGYTDGGANDFQLAGSLVDGAFLDGGSNALIGGSLNSNILGQYIFNVRSGAVVNPGNDVPEPETLALVGLALAGMAIVRRRKTAK